MTDSLQLDDGRRVIVRPVRPQDAAATGSFVERGLSPASRRRRFHRAIRSLPPALLQALTQVDQIGHVALVAESVEGDDAPCGTTVIVAEARYVVEPPGDQAEIALAVADSWQGAGLGTALLNRLCRLGRRQGLPGFRADVMSDNGAMLALLRSRGSLACRHPDDATLRRLWVLTGEPHMPVDFQRGAVVAGGSALGNSSRPARSASGVAHSPGDYR
jgi:acetyltransferase